MNQPSTEKDIAQMNDFLRGELAAVETYDQAIDKVGDDHPNMAERLRDCRKSHRQRANDLDGYVRRLGGEPVQSSEAWGTFAKAVEGTAKLFGNHAAISALEEGEDHGLKDYEKGLDDLSADVRAYIEQHVLPEQQRTHDILSDMQDRV